MGDNDMLDKLKKTIKSNRVLCVCIPLYRKIKFVCRIPKELALYRSTKKAICAPRQRSRIYYIGIPAHNNLGDLAQGVCIRRWLKKHFENREIVEIETNALVNTHFSVKQLLKNTFDAEDIVVFQSGYTTTDLGGYADEMHCEVIKLLPEANMLMMPQTIFFEKEERKENTSSIYSSAKNMMFLARDKVSFAMAQEMFPLLAVYLYPDIVTSLIGSFCFDNVRKGVLLCCRDDSEKFYSDDQIATLMHRLEEFSLVEKTDTTKRISRSEIVKNAEKYIMEEIERYSRYKVIITDRYHGTIFSLIAGTPVIIIKTTDHKVTTGAEWFRGIYDDYVYVADSLDDAFEMSKKFLKKELSHKIEPYFEKEYYSQLPHLFKKIVIEEKRLKEKEK